MGRVLHSKSRMSANTLRPAKQVQKKAAILVQPVVHSDLKIAQHVFLFRPSTLWRLQVTLIQRCQAFMEKFCKSAALAGFTSIHCGRFVCASFFYSFKLIWDLLAVCKLAVVIIVPEGLTEVEETLQQTWAQWRPQRLSTETVLHTRDCCRKPWRQAYVNHNVTSWKTISAFVFHLRARVFFALILKHTE